MLTSLALMSLAVISGSALLKSIVTLVVAGLIFWLVIWFIEWAGIPQPFNKVIKVIAGLVVLIFVINFLLSLIDNQFIKW